MAGFKLFVFDREAHFIGSQESGCSTIGRSQKAVWILAHHLSRCCTHFHLLVKVVEGWSKGVEKNWQEHPDSDQQRRTEANDNPGFTVPADNVGVVSCWIFLQKLD